MRLQAGLVVETGEPREVHHIALPRRLRRQRGEPVPRVRDAPRHVRRGHLPGVESAAQAEKNMSRPSARPPEDDLEDGHLDRPDLLAARRSSRRSASSRRSSTSYFTGTASRIGGIGLDVLAEEALGVTRARSRARDERLPDRRRVPLAPRRRASPVEPGDGRDAPARRARGRRQVVRGVHARWSTTSDAPRHAARPAGAQAAADGRRSRSTRSSRPRRS